MMAEMTELSTSKELEELGSKKAVLEAESRSLKEEQQSLEERIKVLEQQVAIELLKNDNRSMHEAISHLQSKRDELEQRLKEASKTPDTERKSETTPEIFSAPGLKEETAVGITQTGMEETEGDVVTVMPLESPVPTEPEKYSEDLKKQQEKKKRKFL